MAANNKKRIGVRLACWVLFNGTRENRLPFESNAILGGKKREYNAKSDLWLDVLWFVNERLPELRATNDKPPESTTGQELWIAHRFNAWEILEAWMVDLIQLVNTSVTSGIPIATDVLSCPGDIVDYYNIIREELLAISKWNKNG